LCILGLKILGSKIRKKYYLAVTYEVCEHNNIYLDMNEYSVDSTRDLDEQIREFGKGGCGYFG
jgi:hypothetical protein